jgi:hypothetical protein
MFFIPPYKSSVELLRNAETNDKYEYRCSLIPINQIARRACRYIPALSASAAHALPEVSVPQWLRRDITTPVPIVMMDPTADEGMPHTRCTAICIPVNRTLEPTTLYHELIHIHQKQYPARWAAAYKDGIDFEIWPGTLPDELESRRRINPDTVEHPYWIWRSRWVPVPVFVSPSERVQLRKIRVLFYDAVAAEWSSAAPREWVEFFGNSLPESHIEHPHELAAYLIAASTDNYGVPCYSRFILAIKKWIVDRR